MMVPGVGLSWHPVWHRQDMAIRRDLHGAMSWQLVRICMVPFTMSQLHISMLLYIFELTHNPDLVVVQARSAGLCSV